MYSTDQAAYRGPGRADRPPALPNLRGPGVSAGDQVVGGWWMAGEGLVLVLGGALQSVDAQRASWLPSLKIGLYANDWRPTRVSTISEIVPAWFSGNTSLHDLVGWSAAALDGDMAFSEGTVRTWIHDGGPVSSWVFGYYVTDALGALVWAERTEVDGVIMGQAGQRYRVTPRYGVRSRYPN